ncbi:Helicase associated domain protein [Streptomyces sp. Tue6028]|uniref:Helicase associated domain protein n=1 Tax=Streptomyces sp. Tue6028 TaxID=2036037 RepID=UPI003D74E7C3
MLLDGLHTPNRPEGTRPSLPCSAGVRFRRGLKAGYPRRNPDDRFSDFTAGLLVLGRQWYERTAACPDALAERPAVHAAAAAGVQDVIFDEDFNLASCRAYEQLTGETESFWEACTDADTTDSEQDDQSMGESFDFDDAQQMRRILPQLTALYLGPWRAPSLRHAGWERSTPAQHYLLETIRAQSPVQRETVVPVRRSRDHRWAADLAAARQFHAREGHLIVPVKLVEGKPDKLGSFLDNTRRRAGKLSDQRRAELTELGMRWYACRGPAGIAARCSPSNALEVSAYRQTCTVRYARACTGVSVRNELVSRPTGVAPCRGATG